MLRYIGQGKSINLKFVNEINLELKVIKNSIYANFLIYTNFTEIYPVTYNLNLNVKDVKDVKNFKLKDDYDLEYLIKEFIRFLESDRLSLFEKESNELLKLKQSIVVDLVK